MPDYSWDEMTAADIGEEYYDWVAQQGSYSEGDTSFWENLLGPQFEGMEYASFDNFMSEYGGYLPEDFELGPSSLARAGRLADLQQEQFVDEFGRQKNTALQQVGSSGFSGSGMQQTVSEDLWSQYAMQQSALNLQEQQAYQDIYGEQGQSILDQLMLLAEEGAFTDQTYEGMGYDEGGTETYEETCTCGAGEIENNGYCYTTTGQLIGEASCF